MSRAAALGAETGGRVAWLVAALGGDTGGVCAAAAPPDEPPPLARPQQQHLQHQQHSRSESAQQIDEGRGGSARLCGGLGCIVGRFGSLLDHRRTLQPPLVFMLLFQLLLQLLLAVRRLGGLFPPA